MTGFGARLYPAMFALFPLFGLAATNPGWYRLQDIFVLALLVLGGVMMCDAAVYVVARYLFRARRAGDVTALVTFVLIAVFYLYEPVQVGGLKLWGGAHPGDVVILGLGIAALAVWGYRQGWHRHAPALPTVARFLTIAGALLFLESFGRVAYDAAIATRDIRRSALVRELARPIAMRPADPPRTPTALPNVYVFVLDEYAGTDVLRERYGIDNRPFEDSLRALGFRIPAALRSNYANTLMSVASLLNFAQVASLATATGPDDRDYTPGAYLIVHNRAERFLRARGYRYVFFPSTWYGPTRYSATADEQFNPYSHFDLGRAVYQSEFTRDFLDRTLAGRLLGRVTPLAVVYRDHVIRSLAGAVALASSHQPTFAFVHVLMPHIPYVVDAGCRIPAARLQPPDDLAQELQCLNRLMLQTVQALIARSPTPPIIILQGDHGTQALGIFKSQTAVPTVAQARERFRPFGAYYLPNGGGATIPDSTSIVNVLRYVFSYYFNADLPPLPNTMYYSHAMRPYRLIEIDSTFHPMLRPGATRMNPRPTSPPSSRP